MLKTAAILLLLTAAGGAAMAIGRLARKTNPPHWLAMAHGLLAASGLTLLVYAAATQGVPDATIGGLVVLLSAAAGGVVMNPFLSLGRQAPPEMAAFPPHRARRSRHWARGLGSLGQVSETASLASCSTEPAYAQI